MWAALSGDVDRSGLILNKLRMSLNNARAKVKRINGRVKRQMPLEEAEKFERAYQPS